MNEKGGADRSHDANKPEVGGSTSAIGNPPEPGKSSDKNQITEPSGPTPEPVSFQVPPSAIGEGNEIKLQPDKSATTGKNEIVSETGQYYKIIAGLALAGVLAWLAPNPAWWSKAPTVDTQMEVASGARPEAKRLAVSQTAFYVADQNLLNLVKLIAPMNLPEDVEGGIQATVEELFIKSQVANVMFPAGMAVRGVYIHEKTAIVSLAGTFRKNYHTGVWTELLAVYSIVDTVCANFPKIKEVRLLIDDGEEEVFATHVDISVPLSPDFSIVRIDKRGGGKPSDKKSGKNG
jgi:hypothetical protein